MGFEENVNKNFSSTGNPGRSLDEAVDLTEALSKHYDPKLVKSKLAELHDWLKNDDTPTKEERAALGWKQAYNLTAWEEFPGEVLTVSNVLLARMGLKGKGGNKDEAVEEAKVMRGIVRRTSSLLLVED